MILQKKFYFKTWNEWTDIIADSIDHFHNYYELYPNKLIANEHTHSQMAFIAQIRPDIILYNVDKITKEHIPADKENDSCDISKYLYKGGHSLQFYTGKDIPDRQFLLLYDDEPDDDSDDNDDDGDDVAPKSPIYIEEFIYN